MLSGWISQAIICATARTWRATESVGRQQRRLRMDFVEIFDNRERLGQHFAAGKLQRRHALLRIDRTKLLRTLAAAILGQMDGYDLIGESLEI